MKSTETTQKPKRVTLKLIKIESQGDGYYRYIIIRNGNHKKPLYIGLKAIDELDALSRFPKLEQQLKAYYLANGDIDSYGILVGINRLCFP